MGAKRPYKLKYHYDGTRIDASVSDGFEPGMHTIDDTRPIDAMDSFPHEGQALREAEGISRRGGRAEVFHRDPVTKIDTPIRTYEPYEIALADLSAAEAE
jgi:hypothetical protein